MNKNLHFIISLLFVLGTASAQNLEQKMTDSINFGKYSRPASAQSQLQKGSWFIGLAGGPLFGDTDANSQNSNTLNKRSFQTGITVAYSFTADLKLQFEMLFERRGFQSERYVNGFRLTDTSSHVCWECFYAYNVTYFSDYLQMPLLINYSKKKGAFEIAAQAGLFYSLLLVNNHSGYEELYLDPVSADSFLRFGFEPGYSRILYSGPTTNVINTYDAGILIGLSGNYHVFGPLFATLEGRLQLGFAGIYENPEMPDLNFKSYIIRLGLMYNLPKK
jgi:hypothetical protein